MRNIGSCSRILNFSKYYSFKYVHKTSNLLLSLSTLRLRPLGPLFMTSIVPLKGYDVTYNDKYNESNLNPVSISILKALNITFKYLNDYKIEISAVESPALFK